MLHQQTADLDFKAFAKQLHGEAAAAGRPVDMDLEGLYTYYNEKIGKFLNASGVVNNVQRRMVAKDGMDLESLAGCMLLASTDPEARDHQNVAGDDGDTISRIDILIDDLDFPEQLRGAAQDQIDNILHVHFSGGRNGVFRQQFMNPESNQNNTIGLESFIEAPLASRLESESRVAMESFGANIDQGIADIQLSMTTALMRLHLGLTTRMVPTQIIKQPSIIWTVNERSVFDLSDDNTNGEGTSFLELQTNPATVGNDLPPLYLYEDLDDDDVLVEDNVARFGKKINAKVLGINSDLHGYERTNHTDTLADGVRLEKIRIGVAISGIDAGAVKYFDLPITPRERGTLTRRDSGPTTSRSLILDQNFLLGPGKIETEVDDSAQSALFADADDDAGAYLEGLRVNVMSTINADLREAILSGMCSVSVEGHVKSGDLSADWSTAIGGASADNVTVTAVGYVMDAHWSEENLRRSSVVTRTTSRTFAVNIPLGRHHFHDTALQQGVSEDAPLTLTTATATGSDYTNLLIMLSNLENVKSTLDDLEDGSGNLALERTYVAGSKVRPTVVTTTLDLSTVLSVEDANRSGNIRQRAISFLNALVTRLQTGSMIMEQVPAGTNVTYRVGTSFSVLSNVLAQQQIYPHLDHKEATGEDSEIDYRLTLPCGVVLEVVTTNYANMADTLVMVPVLPGNPQSDLNYAITYDMNTVVGTIPFSTQHAAHNRMYANARNMLVPLNPVGAIVNITGSYAASEDPLSWEMETTSA